VSSDNPYAPPQIPTDSYDPARPTTGVFRYGNWLVMHRDSPLPLYCVKTNEPVDMHLSVELHCQGGDDRSVLPDRRTWYGGRRYRVEIPVGVTWLARQRMMLRVSTGLLVCCLALTVAVAIYVGTINIELSLPVIMWGSICSAACYSLVDLWRRPVQLVTISGGFLAFKGASGGFLDLFPPWPHPPPTWVENFLGLRKHGIGLR